MLDLLRDLVISPLSSIIEVFYLLFERITRSPGFAIVGVSLAVNMLALPLYARAEGWQALERDIQKRLKPKVDDIKAVFKGDERMMILSTYYRQNHYHPIYALRSSFGILLQVPFFIAAYVFLSSRPDFAGKGFLFIRDLAAPDGLLAIGSARINVLPLLMTAVNVGASAVYARGLPLREKIQLYAMAALFLILLYPSPSALTLYWTLNNLFSLVKNLVAKTRRPLRTFYALIASFAAAATAYVLFFHETTARKRLLTLLLGIAVLVSPAIAWLGKRLLDRRIRPALQDARDRAVLFGLAVASFAVLAGLAIPTSLIASSTQEFSFVGGGSSPFPFVLKALSQAAGLLVFWPVALYLLFGEEAKAALAAIAAAALPAALLDVYAFGGAYGTISRQLVFPDAALLKPGAGLGAANLAVVLSAATAVAILIAARRTRAVKALLAVCLLSLSSMSVYKAFAIARDYAELKAIRSTEAIASTQTAKTDPAFRLSRRGKNVVVLMLDRAISAFAPMIMAEDPALAESYRGFAWYPNTLSFNGHTLAAAPPLFGGYEYTPDRINERASESLVVKHNEALSVMPRLFSEAGWDCAVSDASWANYSWVPDNSIFKRYPGVRAFNLEGRFTQRWLESHYMEIDPSPKISRNLTRFSLFKTMPMILRYALYDGGKWWDSAYEPDLYSDFIDKYAALDYLPTLFEYGDYGNCFALIVNNTTHDSASLQYPGYVPARRPSEAARPAAFGDEATWRAYQVNMAALKLVGRLLDDMRAQGAYDNSMIIIVADHGFDLDNPAFAAFGEKGRRASFFNPLLMVKDFGASAPFSADRRFRTNADTPAIAARALGGGSNPFTGKPLRELAPGEAVRVVEKSIYDPSDQARNRLNYGESDVSTVKEDLFVEANWSFGK